MNAKEWRAKARASCEAVELTLPSGMAIKARRPGALQLAQWDKLPLLFAGGGEGGAEIDAERAKEIAGFMREMLVYCCVEPRVSEAAAEDAEDEIRPRDLPEKDWMFIVHWGMRIKEAEELRPFRGKRTHGGGSGDSEAVFTEAVGAAGDRGPGAGAGGGPGGSAESGGDALAEEWGG